jgi:hypothetical protein
VIAAPSPTGRCIERDPCRQRLSASGRRIEKESGEECYRGEAKEGGSDRERAKPEVTPRVLKEREQEAGEYGNHPR